jgi:hypothetical protein
MSFNLFTKLLPIHSHDLISELSWLGWIDYGVYLRLKENIKLQQIAYIYYGFYLTMYDKAPTVEQPKSGGHFVYLPLYKSAYCKPSPKIEKREKEYLLAKRVIDKLIYIEEEQMISWCFKEKHPVTIVPSVGNNLIPDYLTKSYFKQFEL